MTVTLIELRRPARLTCSTFSQPPTAGGSGFQQASSFFIFFFIYRNGISVTAQPEIYQQAHCQPRTRTHVSADYFSLILYVGDRGWVLNDDLLMGVCLSQAATHLVSSRPISSLTSQSDTPTLPFAQSKSWQMVSGG